MNWKEPATEKVSLRKGGDGYLYCRMREERRGKPVVYSYRLHFSETYWLNLRKLSKAVGAPSFHAFLNCSDEGPIWVIADDSIMRLDAHVYNVENLTTVELANCMMGSLCAEILNGEFEAADRRSYLVTEEGYREAVDAWLKVDEATMVERIEFWQAANLALRGQSRFKASQHLHRYRNLMDIRLEHAQKKNADRVIT